MKHFRWIALVALAVIPYVGAIRAPLLYDDRTMLDNPWLVREAGPVSVFRHHYWFGTKHAQSDLYRPLTVLSLAWNARATPTKEGIRGVNLALHASAVLALWWMLRRVLGDRKGTVPSERGQSPSDSGTAPVLWGLSPAWIAAALFAVHPLGSEAVLWAVGRAEILAALFGMVAFGLFVRGPVALSVGAFLASLCFKESAAAWLVIGAAWIAIQWVGERPKAGAVAAWAGYFAAFGAYVVLRASAVGWGRIAPPFVDNPLVGVDTATRAANAFLLFGRYVAKMVWPQVLSVEYGFDQIPVVAPLPWGAVAAAAIAGGLAAMIVVLRRSGLTTAAFFVAFVPAAFAVTGNLAFPIGTMFGERLAYLPLAGFCALAGLALAAIPKPAWRGAVVGVLLVACASRAIVRSGDYRDLASLTEATAEASPRAVKALANAGRTRLRQGHADRAVPLLERAVAIWPDYARAWSLLAEAYAASGDDTLAKDAERRASEAASKAPAGDEPL